MQTVRCIKTNRFTNEILEWDRIGKGTPASNNPHTIKMLQSEAEEFMFLLDCALTERVQTRKCLGACGQYEYRIEFVNWDDNLGEDEKS
jgi:hypothetical protein